jgi:hypothetical protein
VKQICNFCSVYAWQGSKKCKCADTADLWTACNKYGGWLHWILVRCGRAAEWTEETGIFEREKIRKRGSERMFAEDDKEGKGNIKMWHVRCLAGCCISVNMAGRLRGWSSRMVGYTATYEHWELGELGVSEFTYIYDLAHLINMVYWLSLSSMKFLINSSRKVWLVYLQHVPGRNKWNIMPTFQLC